MLTKSKHLKENKIVTAKVRFFFIFVLHNYKLRMMKDSPGAPVTAAIGDGGNDVAMIQVSINLTDIIVNEDHTDSCCGSGGSLPYPTGYCCGSGGSLPYPTGYCC